MSLPYSPSRAVYQGNGAATAFPFTFKVWNDDQLDVSITSPDGVSSPAQGWTATLGECGGSVTYLHDAKPLPSGWRLAIVRNMPFSQDIDLVSASRFDPQVIEDGLDQATAERQELNEKIARAVILPATSDKSPEEVVATIYASRDTALASANTAEAAATAAASCAATAEQNVQTATAAAVNTATTQAASAAASALAARTSAEAASDASEGLAPRMDAVEGKNTEQDARLDAVEADNTNQDTRLKGVETALADKADGDLNNVADLPQPLLKNALNAAGGAPVFACRAWVNFDGRTTPPAIRSSGNVSSVTDNGVGDYTVNFTVPMPDDDYSVVCVGNQVSMGAAYCSLYVTEGNTNDTYPLTTTSVRIQNRATGGATGTADIRLANVAVFK